MEQTSTNLFPKKKNKKEPEIMQNFTMPRHLKEKLLKKLKSENIRIRDFFNHVVEQYVSQK